jgi:hypothetical protein
LLLLSLPHELQMPSRAAAAAAVAAVTTSASSTSPPAAPACLSAFRALLVQSRR